MQFTMFAYCSPTGLKVVGAESGPLDGERVPIRTEKECVPSGAEEISICLIARSRICECNVRVKPSRSVHAQVFSRLSPTLLS